MRLGVSVLAANMPETDRLWATITAWWEAIEVLIVTGVTNARTEAANTSIKQIKRTGAPVVATATPPTTALVSCSPAPPGRQREHPSQRDRSPGTVKSPFKRLRTRYERRADIHLGLLRLACALIRYRQLPVVLK